MLLWLSDGIIYANYLSASLILHAKVSSCDWLVSENHSVVSNSLQLYGIYSPWNSPGQNTGVGSLSLLQGNLPNPGKIEPRIKPKSPPLQVDFLPAEP